MTEKILTSKMLVPGSSRRVHGLDRHAGCSITGLISDGRQLVNRGREEASNYVDTYGIRSPPVVLCERLSSFAHYFTLHGALRPFGATAMVAAYDEDEKDYSLHMIEPSGQAYKYYGCAAGKGRQGAKTEIEKLDLQALSCEEGLAAAVKVVLQMRDDNKDKPMELEAGWCKDGKYSKVPDGVLKDAEKKGREELEEEEDMDEDEDE